MSRYSLSHLANDTLLASLTGLIARDRTTTAELLAHLAEVDSRKLFVPTGYPTMFAYCVGQLGLSPDAAFIRIRVARAARRYPGIFDAIADGRLQLTTVVRLYTYLRSWNARELLSAAEHKTRRQVEELIAERFPRSDMPTVVRALVKRVPPDSSAQSKVTVPLATTASTEVAPSNLLEHRECTEPLVPEPAVPSKTLEDADSVEPVLEDSAEPFTRVVVDAGLPPARTTPLSPERYAIQFTVSRETYERLCRVQDLLASAVTSSDIPEVFDRALKLLEAALERRRFSATENPRACAGSSDAHHVPAEVQREVWDRDGGRCSYVSADGHRCESRRWLEYDHAVPVARGGRSTVLNVRLRCKAHNQLAAEVTFGAAFMQAKRGSAGHRLSGGVGSTNSRR